MVKYDKRGVPFSTATNAYDFINDSIKVIQDEPLRLDMKDWKQGPESIKWLKEINQAPACGTVCCWAGWNATLARKGMRQPWHFGDISSNILLGPYKYIDRDWAASCDELESIYTMLTTGSPGTKKYVAKVVKRIMAFQSRHKARLKAQKVTPPRIAKAGQRPAKTRPRQSPAKARTASRS